MGSKLIISAASFIVAGGINWALTKSMQKSVAIGAVAAGGALAALKLRKTWLENTVISNDFKGLQF